MEVSKDMDRATFEPQIRTRKQRMLRVYRRSIKAPFKVIQKLQGYDNSQPILLEDFKAIYFQIPKVASSSLKRLLKDEMNLGGLSPHSTRFPVINYDKLDAGFYADYYKFCFVRNPWKRLVSCYHAKISNSQWNINETFWTKCLYYVIPKSSSSGYHRLTSLPVINKHMSFDEFIYAVANIPDEFANKHFRSQYTFICDPQGELLVDFIGHLESFDDDFQFVGKQIGLKIETKKHKPTLKRSPFKDYYSKDTWDLVAQRYQRDIQLLGYSDNQY
jgi:chondroitin 4-sulfotransferase 11